MTRGLLIRTGVGLALVLALAAGGLWRSGTVHNPARQGETMGSTYSIKIAGKIRQRDLKEIARRIDGTLAEINRQMSTWDPESEISRFNHSTNLGPFRVSAGFSAVAARSIELSKATGGAFDPTLLPLLNLWGFGSGGSPRRVPSQDLIDEARQSTGWEKISLDASSNLCKSVPSVQLDFSAIAPGYGADLVADVLEGFGLGNWFIEIGGEVVVRGLNPDGEPWKIGIQYPTTNPMDERLHGIIHLSNGAVATSGNYRNYIRENGSTYSHILDPRSGCAIQSETASVTVLAADCTTADGLATALFVMGCDAGLALVEQLPGVEAMFLVRDGNDEIIARFSSGFARATRYSAAH